jgi:ribonuclease III
VRGRTTPIERALGVRFKDPKLRQMALTHRSYAFERDQTETNERLEFLGDAVLGLVVTDLAFARFPDLPEGDLAKLRAATVNMLTLADIAAGTRPPSWRTRWRECWARSISTAGWERRGR